MVAVTVKRLPGSRASGVDSLVLRLPRVSLVCHHVHHQFLAAFAVAVASLEYAHAAGGDADGMDFRDAAFIHLGVEPEPVGAEQASGNVESDADAHHPLKVVARAIEEAPAEFVDPGSAAHERFIEEVAR